MDRVSMTARVPSGVTVTMRRPVASPATVERLELTRPSVRCPASIHDSTIAGLVLISGLYDFPAFLDEPRTAAAAAIRSTVIAQTGGSRGALAQRSALLRAPAIKARTLILNGARDDRTDSGQATPLAEAINGAGGRAQVHIYPEFGHEIPFSTREPLVSTFIDFALTH